LARIAIEAYEQADLRAETLRGELRRLSDRGLQASLGKTWGEIGALFMWLPGSRLQQILYRPPWFSYAGQPFGRPGDVMEQLALPYIAYVTVAKLDRADEDLVRAYIDLSIRARELEDEQARRWGDDKMLRVLSALLLGWGDRASPDEQVAALEILEKVLPLREVRRGVYGGARVDRLKDFPQALRLHMLELVRERVVPPETPEQVLAALNKYEARLAYIPHAAADDFRNARATERRQDEIHELLAADENRQLKAVKLPNDPRPSTRRLPRDPARISPPPPQEAALAAAGEDAMAAGVEATEAHMLGLFRHTTTERAVLRAMLTSDHDPKAKGYIKALAAQAGCSRKWAGLYRAKLRARLRRK
jgi:hypothetical protein